MCIHKNTSSKVLKGYNYVFNTRKVSLLLINFIIIFGIYNRILLYVYIMYLQIYQSNYYNEGSFIMMINTIHNM